MVRRPPKKGRPPARGLLPLRDLVVFPGMVLPLFVGRERSIAAIELAMKTDRILFLVAQKRVDTEQPEQKDLYRVGTLAEVVQLSRLPDGSMKALVEGLSRERLLAVHVTERIITCETEPIEPLPAEGPRCEAAMRRVLAQFEHYVKIHEKVPHEVLLAVQAIEDPGLLADSVAAHMLLRVADKQQLLSMADPVRRLLRLSLLLTREIEILQIEQQIKAEARTRIEQSQREYYLTEQLKVIQRELGRDVEGTEDLDELEKQIVQAAMPPEVLARAQKELARLRAMSPYSPEATISRTYLDWLVSLPWSAETEDCLDLGRATQILEEDHYGLEKPKQRVLEYLAVRKLAGKETRAPILCFVGPPGVGKTSLGRSIARAMGRNFIRVSLGGVRDEAEIRGHRRTYIGALPGRIIQSMRRAHSTNPVFMLDEVDKMSMDFRGDPSAALLEVLDPEQNQAFSDHYLEVDYDLSRVMFIMTANVTHPIPAALLDRMELIEIPSYTEDEKLEIARRFLIPKERQRHGLVRRRVVFDDAAVLRIIRQYTREAGVRNLERQIATVCRKLAREIVSGASKSRGGHVTAARIDDFLGIPLHRRNEQKDLNGIGTATGLAWTSLGGEVLLIEATVLDGTGNLVLTGQMGDVMQESAKAALTFARSRARALNLARDFYRRFDVHVHIPEGAIPKDGPSAGVTMATAIISALTGRPVRQGVAMTGEITLRGRVLSVGGIKEKVIAAHRAEIERVLLPAENERDLQEVPAAARNSLRFVFVETMDDVLREALC